ncbi:MAG: phage head-tail joining protein [Mycobacterium sp.]
MATLQEQLDALKAARASGEKRVTYDGKTREFRDIAEINQAIAAVEGEINGALATPRSRSAVAYFNRGHS